MAINYEEMRQLSNMYWEEEEELKTGIHPTQVIERISKELADSGKDSTKLGKLNWLDGGLVEVFSENNEKIGVFDYINTNKFI